jgi:D-alanine-D-alanine ligase
MFDACSFPMKVAILHNLRPQGYNAAVPDDAFEEYDSCETVAAIGEALARMGVRPVPVIADARLPRRLEDGEFDFAFNIAEGQGRRCREAIPAAVCELLGIPFTGSDALTLAVTLDKAVARRIVSPDVPVARGVLIAAESGEPELARLSYPVIVKPNDEGSSKGIWLDSLCRDHASAAERCQWLRDRYDCPALVEEFLPGAEVTVGIRGNGARTEVLGLMQIVPALESGQPFLYSVETKRDWRSSVRYHIPPALPAATQDLIRALALTAYQLLGCRDLARIDFRLNDAGQPVFLECNPLPGLNPDSGDIVILSSGVLSYEMLIQGVLRDAAERFGVPIP